MRDVGFLVFPASKEVGMGLGSTLFPTAEGFASRPQKNVNPLRLAATIKEIPTGIELLV